MNFLAHLFLTHTNDDWTIGNFIADSVRSSQLHQFTADVRVGVKIHHEIDAFTDSHPVVKQTQDRLRAKHLKYSSVISDIVYDHFLAKNFSNYSTIELKEFTQSCYKLFRSRWDEIPAQVQHMLFYMEKDDWLFNYQHQDGLNKALSGMGRRASFENKMHEATQDVFDDYSFYEEDFALFFPELEEHIKGIKKSYQRA